MGMSMSGNGRQQRLMSDINVTPFVDVMLVLADHLHGSGTAGAEWC